jgi:hypothetical protein
MTLFYDSEANAVIENHPDEWITRDDDDGRLVIDFDTAPRAEKVRALLNAAADAVEASDEYDLVTEPETEWIGGN